MVPPDQIASHPLNEQIAFLKHAGPKATYICSVCGGAFQLALAGLLEGKRATTNKQFYRMITAMAPGSITWVAKARWVVDGNVWTSSGVAAGGDMALAFLAHISSPEIARAIRGGIEIPEVTEEEDVFAKWHGLV
ncbi:DJ-1 protein-PfpI domain-containing protein [Mycena kentingensis (nom. inval.)]|nr:DJ-1 protein-PfpI domain-containing protein [Mycena kentingensis (nom. inval.)]